MAPSTFATRATASLASGKTFFWKYPPAIAIRKAPMSSANSGATGAARRAAGHPRQIMRIARRSVVHILAGEVVGVFAHIERADQDRAGNFHALDQGGVARGRLEIAIDLRSGSGREPPHVEQVLYRER